MIIDIHGHYTTAPKALETWRNRQIAGITHPAEAPKAAELRISDDELQESIEGNQLRLMRERGLDLTIFSPRASFDTTAFMQCLTSDLFRDFPTLRFVVPHGGGAVPYHWGRFRGLAQDSGAGQYALQVIELKDVYMTMAKPTTHNQGLAAVQPVLILLRTRRLSYWRDHSRRATMSAD
jgi:hypothetical protein